MILNDTTQLKVYKLQSVLLLIVKCFEITKRPLTNISSETPCLLSHITLRVVYNNKKNLFIR